ncbi:DnaJ domain-containing protein [Neobacillus rhizosphaerae]|uniref:J domain-containing protein n=1 Tax=Neobacillus rhizosphaerae TaxID=2880965 RepID=UPI003D2B1433
MGSFGNYYRILDVPYDATFFEIKEAYRKKVKEVHPDIVKGNAEQFKRVKEAYEVLKNVEKRKRYDNLLFNEAHDKTRNQKQESTAKTNPSIKIVKIKSKTRKQFSLSSVTLNASLFIIGVYLNKKRK